MKKGVFVELVYRTIYGGKPTTDGRTRREDIVALLPAVINYTNTGSYWDNVSRDDDREVPSSFVREHLVCGVCVDDSNRSYVSFDHKFVNMPGGGGIRYVQDMSGNSYSPRAMGVSRKRYFDDALVESFEFTYMDGRLYLYNKPDLVDCFNVAVVTGIEDLSDDDDIPIPGDYMPAAIDMMVGFFTNQRMQPKDYVINGIDPLNEV